MYIWLFHNFLRFVNICERLIGNLFERYYLNVFLPWIQVQMELYSDLDPDSHLR